MGLAAPPTSDNALPGEAQLRAFAADNRPGVTQAAAKCKVDDHFAPSVADQGSHRVGFAQCRPFLIRERRDMDVPRRSTTA